MVLENYYSKSMAEKSDAELQEYVSHHTDYQEEAVLAAIWELEKRHLVSDTIKSLKARLELQTTASKQESTAKEEDLALYSYNFIILFGLLFSVFGGSILIGLNLLQLKNKYMARMAVLSGFGFSLLQVYLMGVFKISSPVISVLLSLLGIRLLYFYFLKSALNTNIDYIKKSVWPPLAIGALISLPIAYFLMKSGVVV